MATGDGSPTSGGSGDEIVTEDTFTDTGTGTSGVKLAGGKVWVGEKGVSRGPAATATPLDVRDYRVAEQVRDTGVQLFRGLQRLWHQMAVVGVFTRQRQGHSPTIRGITAATSSVVIATPLADRMSLKIVNDSTSSGNLYLRLGGGAASSASGGYTVMLAPSAYYELQPSDVELGVTGIWSATGGFANVTEVS
jgi:hypothetical protein